MISRGHEVGVPRYYDKIWKHRDPEGFEKVKLARKERVKDYEYDQTFDRLKARLKCQEIRFKHLIRRLDSEL